MTCNSVATATSQLKCDAGLLLESEQTIKATSMVVAKTLGVEVNRVRHFDYGYSHYFQCTPWTIIIHKDGEVEVQNSAISFYNTSGQTQMREMTEKITTALNQLAGLVVQTKTVQALQRAVKVDSQQRASNGAMVLTFKL